MGPGRLATLILAATVAGSLDAQELPELAAKLQRSVVVLDVEDAAGDGDSFGTGFFISRDGHIATNYHVVEGATAITARTFDDEALRVTAVLAVDETNDLAIVLAEGSDHSALTLGRSDAVSTGARVVVLGNPLGLDFTLSEGIVSAVREAGKLTEPGLDVAHLQITAPTAPGSSGSPVVDLSGEVVGVVASGYVRTQNLNFAVPVDLLRELEERARTSPSRVAFSDRRAGAIRNLGLSAAFFIAVFWGLRLISRTSRSARS